MNDVDPGSTHRRLIEWTGERCVPWTGDLQVVYEHYHRYLLARPLVEGKRVLDLASGEGTVLPFSRSERSTSSDWRSTRPL